MAKPMGRYRFNEAAREPAEAIAAVNHRRNPIAMDKIKLTPEALAALLGHVQERAAEISRDHHQRSYESQLSALQLQLDAEQALNQRSAERINRLVEENTQLTRKLAEVNPKPVKAIPHE